MKRLPWTLAVAALVAAGGEPKKPADPPRPKTAAMHAVGQSALYERIADGALFRRPEGGQSATRQ